MMHWNSTISFNLLGAGYVWLLCFIVTKTEGNYLPKATQEDRFVVVK